MSLINQIIREKHRQRVVAMEEKVHELRKCKHRIATNAMKKTFILVCQKYKDQDKEELLLPIRSSSSSHIGLCYNIDLHPIHPLPPEGRDEPNPLTYTFVISI
jgi:hypothetical protein